jgi:hypothetical protein
MSELFEFAKKGDALVPAGERGRIKIGRLGDGEIVLAVLRRPRNIGFHRKAMALFRLAFDQWNPQEKSIEGMPAKKSFDVFRRELVIQAGYYDVVLGFDGEPRLEAKSLRFDRMEEDEFNEVYEAVVAVLLGGILSNVTRDEADKMALAVEQGGF